VIGTRDKGQGGIGLKKTPSSVSPPLKGGEKGG